MSTQTTDQTAQDAEAAKAAKAEQAAAAKAEKARVAAEKKEARLQERIAKVLSDGGVLPYDVEGTGPDGAVTLDDAKAAVSAKKKAERESREKKAPLTLSQRRALVRLQKHGPRVAQTGFNELPFEHLVTHGLAIKEDVEVEETYTVKEPEEYFEGEGENRVKKTRKVDVEKTRTVTKSQYTATEKGLAREVNAKWETWKPDSAASSTPAPEPSADDAA